MALRFTPMIACEDTWECPAHKFQTRNEPPCPVPKTWAGWACHAPCCFGLCQRVGTAPDGTCGDPRHVGRRILGRALFRLWDRRLTTSPLSSTIGLSLLVWYRCDLQSLLSHPVGMPLCRPNSRSEDEHACVLASNLTGRCTLFHHDCRCFAHSRSMSMSSNPIHWARYTTPGPRIMSW